MKQPTQIFPTSMRTYSDVYASRASAAYMIGRPDGAMGKRYAVSKDEALEIVTNLPEELLEAVKEHYSLIPSGVTAYLAKAAEPVTAEAILQKVEEELQDGTLGLKQFEAIKAEYEDPAEEEGIDLGSMNIKQLRKVASDLGITGYTKYDKDTLKEKIETFAAESEEQ
jgi:hypothetical protein